MLEQRATEVQAIRQMFDALSGMALPAEESAQLITKVAATL